MPYKLTVGLEIHAELKTATKMFCRCKNDPDEARPNANICPVCMGHPGTLPVLNKEAIRHVLKIGHAVGGTIADFTEWDRKNYFYPDIPKNYQISQYKYPLVSGGELAGVQLTRIHLEEDTATSKHDQGDYSLVDFNRAGVPLMELVTEPVIHDAAAAGAFAKELQLLLRTLGAGDANMEKGEMRVEANISVSDTEKLGTKVEVKNLNSFRSVERAIDFEMKRHIEALENGEEIVQETRGWDEAKQATFSQRKKESSHDYRYFPEPDLPKLIVSELSEFSAEALRSGMPELPWARRERYEKEGIKAASAEILASNFAYNALFDAVMTEYPSLSPHADLVANYVVSDLLGLVNSGKGAIPSVESFGKLIELKAANKITTRVAKDVLALMVAEDADPEQLMEKHGLSGGAGEDELKSIVAKIVADNPKVVADYKGGKEASLQFLLGQGMRPTKGSADPETLKSLLLGEMGK